jgi:hypothetical protein
MDHRIDTVSGRRDLPARREPYWHKMRRDVYVEFRKSAKGWGALGSRVGVVLLAARYNLLRS